MDIEFYGIYSSCKDGTSVSFATKPYPNTAFPPTVSIKGHEYYLASTMQTSTELQRERFDSYCVYRNIERNIDIS